LVVIKPFHLTPNPSRKSARNLVKFFYRLTRDLDVEGTILPNTIKTRSGKNLPRNTAKEGTKILRKKALAPNNPEWFAEGVKQTRSPTRWLQKLEKSGSDSVAERR
jgi:hypothetical protein